MSLIDFYSFYILIMAYFIDTSLVLILRNYSEKLKLQLPNIESTLDIFASFLVHELMMQQHRAGQGTAMQPIVQLLMVP